MREGERACLGGELFARSFATGGFASGLLSTSHLDLKLEAKKSI
jgi:hypothetical protein